MDKSEYKIHVIGAGISGLIAANVLEASGYHPVILESTESVGGRVKTDCIDDYQLDHGFQVLLTAYPAAKKYLDYEKLSLQKFVPGAVIFDKGKKKTIGDPTRDISLLFSTISANIGSLSDKIKILKLNAILKKKSIERIFSEKEKTTLAYLRDFGFSEEIIQQFFTPFFSGIFLEPKLETSSRMFEFIYKMFGEGHAAIPQSGIAAIAEQLLSRLNQTSIQYNTTVQEVEDGKIVVNHGQELKSHFTIIATAPSYVIPKLKNQAVTWKSCETLYFETHTRNIDKPLIGLIADPDSLINNICYHTSLNTACNPEKELLSVTVVKDHNLEESNLITAVEAELLEYCNIKTNRFIKLYTIEKALPDIKNVLYDMAPTETRLTTSIFVAGDQLLNGSLNAAMIAGERAALGVIGTLEDGLIVEEFTSEFT
ncbi:FAD-dependent oxidoreductase [Aquimarina sp. U1-2]|uniref:FAD-dependent oxidoreductase n=1 Tax=Aquimarina sp. U1-2 TaxID=2823141 RepID=UPI001AECC03F|nr:FAD-dependent oxidoreductase [Aquimarina sp. U1-2]MBP2830756.1 FAD-dependent oxidoreductase [Aquimarina sp. U1-2]